MAWRLQIDVRNFGEIPSPEPASYGKRMLELQKHWIGYRTRDTWFRIIDFNKRLSFELNQIEHTCFEGSLFSAVAFRHFELRNRLGIASVLEAGGGDSSTISNVLHEHNLAMVDGAPIQGGETALRKRWNWLYRVLGRSHTEFGSHPDILFNPGEDWWSFTTTSGAPLAQFSANGEKCERTLLKLFARFLRFFVPVHPFILDRLTAGEYLPSLIRMQAQEGHVALSGGIELEILSIQKIPDREFSLDDYRYATPKHYELPIDLSIERATAQPPEDRDLVALRTGEICAFRSAGKPLEAALSYMELIIETGSAPGVLSEAVRNDSDKRTKQLLLTLEPATKEQAQSAIDTLLVLRSEASHGAHILMILEAWARALLGQSLEAIALFAKAIEVNPYLAGAYKGLGDEYAGLYQFERAWRCWSVARRLAPTHPMMDHLYKMEEMLIKQHPEYF